MKIVIYACNAYSITSILMKSVKHYTGTWNKKMHKPDGIPMDKPLSIECHVSVT